jgi:hypothetical protein
VLISQRLPAARFFQRKVTVLSSMRTMRLSPMAVPTRSDALGQIE